MKLVYDYVSMRFGFDVEDSIYKTIKATVDHLIDNGFTDKDIFKILMSSDKSAPTVLDLPDSLWEESLLNKGEYYYSGMLQIKSKAPTWNPITFKEECEPFFKEMRIKFTTQDLLSHYYMECRVPLNIRDYNRDKAGMDFLLKKYNNLDVPSVDYIIYMIKLYSEDISKDYSTNLFEIENYRPEAIRFFDKLSKEAALYKENIITWRK